MKHNIKVLMQWFKIVYTPKAVLFVVIIKCQKIKIIFHKLVNACQPPSSHPYF